MQPVSRDREQKSEKSICLLDVGYQSRVKLLVLLQANQNVSSKFVKNQDGPNHEVKRKHYL